MLRRPLRMLTCLAVGALLVASCSGSHGTLGSEQSRGIQPFGPPDLSMLAEARQKNEVGSEFVARYYLFMVNRAIMSLDSSPLRELSRHCRACDALADAMDAAKARRDTRVCGLVTVDSMSTSVIHGNAATVTFHFALLPVTALLDGTPAEQVLSASEKFEGRIEMTWDEAYRRWAVTDLGSKRVSR